MMADTVDKAYHSHHDWMLYNIKSNSLRLLNDKNAQNFKKKHGLFVHSNM